MFMRRYVIVLCAGLLLGSCGMHELGESARDDVHDGIWTGPGMNVGSSDPDRTVCYVTTMDYPDGYDWRADREKGSVKCSLVVYADGIPMMKVPVGEEYQTSPDADMHRIICGHLYTDYSTQEETVIRKDGKEIFRYSGREVICGMLVDGDDVYTLGHPRDNGGFTYRRNGEILLSRPSGKTFSRLYRDGEDICFAFCEQASSLSSPLERYYSVVNGVPEQAALRDDVKKVWDMMYSDGKVHYIASLVGARAPVLFAGESMCVLTLPQGASLLTGRLSVSQGVVCVEGVLSCRNLALASALWKSEELLYTFSPGMTVASWQVEGDGVFCVLNSRSSSQKGVIYRCGEVSDLPQGYVSMGGNTVALADGIMHVGLSSVKGGKPLLWKEGVVDTLDINGYISSVIAEKQRRP